MKKFCLFFCCCGCLIVLLILVGAGVMGYTVYKKGLEPPPNYVKSTVALDEAKGKELKDKIYAGGQDGRLELTLSKADLRNLVASLLGQAFQHNQPGGRAIKVEDIQISFGSPKDLPAAALPGRAYPVPLDKSVRIDLITAVNISGADDPIVLYPTMKILAGVENCGLYWAIVDMGIGPYAMMDVMKLAEQSGAVKNSSSVEKVPLPPASCATELSHTEDALRVVVGPEAP